MMKRLFSLFLVALLLVGALPFSVSATNVTDVPEVVRFEDGSYIMIFTETSTTRVANTVSGSKKYVCYDGNDNKDWEAKLSATFAYSGAWYTCTTANCTVTIYDSQWYEISNTTTRSSNNAFAYLTMGRRVLGVTVERPEYTIKLTCDINGNLS